MASDMLYMLTFAVGIFMFWLSGHVVDLIPVLPNEVMDTVVSVGVTTLFYALGIAIFTFFMLRRQLKPALIAGLVAFIVGVIADQVIVGLASGHISTQQELGIVTFVLYLTYGSIYVLALAIGRKVAKQHPLKASFDAPVDPPHNE